ncbi:MAG: hydroxymethylbilane synthase [Actinobacteria bacterium]|nr:hydroxymethylbilane synthase [Actinomycetota bacterium]
MALRIATRSSAQALAQTGWVADRLRAAHPGLEVALVPTETTGDLDRSSPIWELGGKGVFAKEVQVAVLSGAADLAVHSGKDLPSSTPEGLTVAAVPTRRDPRDALVGSRLADLAPGARVATGSIRRRAQLAALRPDLTFAGLRGNIATRLERAAEHDAIVIAVAALQWLDLTERIAEVLEPDRMLPQVAQGTLAVECRSDDSSTAALLAPLEDAVARRCFEAERSFLRTLGGDCSLPAGVFAVPLEDGRGVSLEAVVAAVDGTTVLRHRVVGAPVDAGRAAAEYLLASGGAALLGR